MNREGEPGAVASIATAQQPLEPDGDQRRVAVYERHSLAPVVGLVLAALTPVGRHRDELELTIAQHSDTGSRCGLDRDSLLVALRKHGIPTLATHHADMFLVASVPG